MTADELPPLPKYDHHHHDTEQRIMYGITARDKQGQSRFFRLAEVARHVSDVITAKPELREEGMRHLSELESLDCRGMKYANHDFDVLSHALRFAMCHGKLRPEFERVA